MKKSWIFLLVMTIVAGLFVGCAPKSDEGGQPEGEQLKVAYVTMDATSPYFISMINGMKEKAEELGIDLTIHDGKYEAQPQIDAMETLIVQGVDVIILSANDPVALQPSVDKAKEAGIKVIAANVEMENTDAYVSLVEKEYGLAGGEIAGKYIAEKMNGEAKVAVLAFTQVPAVIQRTEGLKEGIKKYAPNAEFVAEVEANNFVLTPGRYVGTEEVEDDGIPYDEKVTAISENLKGYFEKSIELQQRIKTNLVKVGIEI